VRLHPVLERWQYEDSAGAALPDHGREQIRRPNDALMNVGNKPADITKLERITKKKIDLKKEGETERP
jgi:hypothetical protein